MIRDSCVKNLHQSIRFIPVKAIEIKKIISKLNKSPGIDNIRISDLKVIKESISPVIAHLVNISIKTSKYLDMLKTSIIRPIYKSGEHDNTKNYRPIAILSSINKIFENLIVHQLTNFFTKNNVITETQYGFQKGKSTQQLLNKFTNEINNHINNKKHVGILFIDFKRAFDTLDHQTLLNSLDECGIRRPLLNWFTNYLHNRSFSVKIKDEMSNRQTKKYGVVKDL